MNFKNSLNRFLYKLFSKKNFIYIFGLLLIIMFIIILHTHNNLIEGNTNSVLNNLNNQLNNQISNASNKKNQKNQEMSGKNSQGNNIINISSNMYNNPSNTEPFIENININNIEAFIENMNTDNINCTNNNYFNSDSKNSASNLVNNACLQRKKLIQENRL